MNIICNRNEQQEKNEFEKFLKLLQPSIVDDSKDEKIINDNFANADEISIISNIQPPSLSDNVNNNNFQSKTIGLLKINFDDYDDQYKAIGQLRKHNETIDLILSTIDGGNESVHQYFLAWRAPKFWQRLIEKSDKNQSMINIDNNDDDGHERVKLTDDDNRISMESITNQPRRRRRLFVPKEFIDESILLRLMIDSMYRMENYNNDHQSSSTINYQQQFNYFIAWKLLKIANEFQLEFLLRDCIIYFHSRIGLSNCIDLWKVGQKFFQYNFGEQLAKCSYRFLLINLIRLLHSNQYCNQIQTLTIGQLRTIIDDNRLNIRNEIEIWFLIKKWIEFDPLNRSNEFLSLFSQIRFNLIDMKSIKIKLIPDLLQFDFDKCHGNLWKNFQNQKPKIDLETFRPRIPHQLLLLYGGYEDGYPSTTIKTFDIRSRQWFRFYFNKNDHYPRVHHQLVNLENKVYILGGSDGLNCLNTVICWNLTDGSRTIMAPMLESRSFHCALRYSHRFIIVCGGYNGQDRLRSVELYDSRFNCWRYLPPMQSIRSDASATIFNDCIYIAGGIDIFPLNSMEYYSFETNQWTIISFMHIQRRSFSLIPYNGLLYAIGGCTEIYEYNCLKSVERYNPITNTWYFAPPLLQPRMSASVAILEDRIFVIGGYDGFTTYRTVFIYHHSQSYWQQLQYELPVHLSGSVALVITNMMMLMINTIDYTYYGQFGHLINDKNHYNNN
uniref:Kelch-like protein 10 n=1 Tax=Dermatophagoides pteronyssinus TaxID=6956 RepID=A0A6P6XKE4_DERPT